jgi:hypothetical protein
MKLVNPPARHVSLMMAIVGLSLAGAARAQDAPPPSAPPGPCVMVVGGGVPVTPDPQVNAFWLQVNRVVSADVQTELAKRGYVVDGMVADSPDTKQRLTAVAKQLNQDRCEKAIQVSVSLKGTAEQPDVISTFEFDILVFHLNIADVPGQPMKSVRVAGDYSRSYPYPLSKAVMDTLPMTAVSAQIAGDIDAAKVLPPAK